MVICFADKVNAGLSLREYVKFQKGRKQNNPNMGDVK
jgi:hypothetical protein